MNEEQRGVHFIIYSPSRHSIWSGTFKTKADADTELEFQLSTLPVEVRTKLDWKVESRVNAHSSQ